MSKTDLSVKPLHSWTSFPHNYKKTISLPYQKITYCKFDFDCVISNSSIIILFCKYLLHLITHFVWSSVYKRKIYLATISSIDLFPPPKLVIFTYICNHFALASQLNLYVNVLDTCSKYVMIICTNNKCNKPVWMVPW